MVVQRILWIGNTTLLKKIAKLNEEREYETWIVKTREKEIVRALIFTRPIHLGTKLRPLLSSLDGAEDAFLVINKLDSIFGEILVSCSVNGISKGTILLQPDEEWIDPNQIKLMLEQVNLTKWKVLTKEPDTTEMRIKWIENVDTTKMNHKEPLIVIDQSFTVTGIGTVALGNVLEGRVKKHDELIHARELGKGIVRSIQVLDEEVEYAQKSDRVGLALRGIDPKILSKGDLLHTSSINKYRISSAKYWKGELELSPFMPASIEQDSVVHLSGHGQFIEGRVISFAKEDVVIEFLHSNPLPTGNSWTLVKLDAKPIRIVGRVINLIPKDDYFQT